MIHVVIPGEPHSQQRHRAMRRGKHAATYDPKANKSWKGAAQVHMLEAMDGREPLTGPVVLTVTAVFALPKSKHRKRNRVQRQWSGNAKDIDNICKAVMDAANGVLWVDDRQVVNLKAWKFQGAQDEAPFVRVTALEAVGP